MHIKKMPMLFFSIFLFLILLLSILTLFPSVLSRTSREKQETLEHALHYANIQCYATEGRYAPSIAYLEENYGVIINHHKYKVFYDSWADNIMPEITVINLNTLKGDAYETEE